MAAPASTRRAGAEAQESGCYVYGIVPADAELGEDSYGVGDPPGRLHLIYHGDIAALVSEVSLGSALGTPDDLMAHSQILDATAAEVPVLPLRFGAVLTSEDAVAEELLGPHHDQFADALAEMDGLAEYVVKGRYVEQVILGEVLAENPEAAALADEIQGTNEDATRPGRMELGEILNEAVTAKRQADTSALGDAVAPYCTASVVRDPAHELDAVNVALLVETLRREDLEQAISGLAQDWEGRIGLRLLGPLAPWDFIHTPIPGTG